MPERSNLEERSRALFRESVEGLDLPMRSRLTRARYAALAAAERRGPTSWFARTALWTPAAGVSVAAVLAMALWIALPPAHHGFGHGAMTADSQSLEDLELVAASDESSGDALEMLQDDVDFYTWADKAAGAEPAA